MVAFGGVEKHKEALREGRGLAWLGGLSLDLKVASRLLAKYPGLTIIGGLAMAFAIWVGAVTFHILTLFMHPTLPLPDGDRIVQLWNWDLSANDPDPCIATSQKYLRNGFSSGRSPKATAPPGPLLPSAVAGEA